MISKSWKLHHIGYLVVDIEKSIKAYQALGFDSSFTAYDEDRKAYICFLSGNMCGEGRIELVAPTKESDIFPLLKQYRNTPYHLCFEVDDLDKTVATLKKDGFLLFREKQKAMAISDTARVVFLIHASIGIVELVQME